MYTHGDDPTRSSTYVRARPTFALETKPPLSLPLSLSLSRFARNGDLVEIENALPSFSRGILRSTNYSLARDKMSKIITRFHLRKKRQTKKKKKKTTSCVCAAKVCFPRVLSAFEQAARSDARGRMKVSGEKKKLSSEIARPRLGVVNCLARNELRVPVCVRRFFFSSSSSRLTRDASIVFDRR